MSAAADARYHRSNEQLRDYAVTRIATLEDRITTLEGALADACCAITDASEQLAEAGNASASAYLVVKRIRIESSVL